MSTIESYPYADDVAKRGFLSTATAMLFGVFLPAATILIEVSTGFCAQHFFNPIPTWWHVAAVSLVPIVNCIAVAAPKTARAWPRAMGTLSGISLAIALYFTIVFLPITPLACVAVLAIGLGLLPLSPAISLIVGLWGRAQMRRAAEGRLRGLVSGLLIGAAAMLLIDARVLLTYDGLLMAEEPASREAGLRQLRRFGDRGEMLRACYDTRSAGKYAIGWLLPAGPSLESARATYYRVTGESFADADRPREERTRFDWDSTDAGTGGSAVAGRVHDLYLAESKIDGVVDGDAAFAYLEWQMTFRNDQKFQSAEARLQMALPPGAVASRVTLWVNGVPCEAAFGGREQTRQAYTQTAVVERRDPLLVTTAGPDRLLVQCFPILAGQTMKIRIGMTAPLEVTTLRTATLQLPAILERNFDFAAAEHTVFLEGGSTMTGPRLSTAHRKDGRHELVGALPDGALARRPSVSITRQPVTAVLCEEPVAGHTQKIVQRLTPPVGPPPSRVIAVVDLSKQMQPYLPLVAEGLEELAGETSLSVLAAGDTVQPVADPASLAALSAVGGIDATAALTAAMDMLAAEPNAAVLWVHGPQPELLESPAALRGRLERRGRDVPVMAVQIVPGPNRVMEQLEGYVQPRYAFGTRQQRTAAIAGVLRDRPMTITREAVSEPLADLPKASSHVARLWAVERVRQMLRINDGSQRPAALALATDYQLVTPVSGAVVLETAAQYARANLQPVDPSTTPGVPEPGSLAVLVMAGMGLMARRRRRRVA